MASPRWEALVDVLSRPKTKMSVKRDVLMLFNVLVTTAPTIEERVQLRRVLNKVNYDKTFNQLCKFMETVSKDDEEVRRQLDVQLKLYNANMFDDVQSLDRLCRYAGLKILWSKDSTAVARDSSDTRTAKNK